MVALIKAGQSIHRILSYNENKLQEGSAHLLYSEGYPVDAALLSFSARQNRLLMQVGLNRNVKRNSVHISLNFDPSETLMPSEKFVAIAKEYMEHIGFGEQPYLVYRHFDAGHPHLHIVTTNITSLGSSISLHHLAIRKSEPARLAIEKKYGLIEAAGRKKQKESENAAATKALYGKTETKKAIQNVLEAVLDKYRFRSLSQLNAVLEIYNIRAENGQENSRLRRHGGLLYRLLDDAKQPVGVPIKASLFYNKPTLKRLDIKFASNGILAPNLKARIKNEVEKAAIGMGNLSLNDLKLELSKSGIALIERRSENRLLYGITFVDHTTGGVFNGSELGKSYGAKALLNRFPDSLVYGDTSPNEEQSVLRKLISGIAEERPEMATLISEIAALLKGLAKPEYISASTPGIGRKRKKKRKRRGTGNN